MTPADHDQTADSSDDDPADRIEGDHARQQECEYHQRSAPLTRAVSPGDRNLGDTNQKCNGEDDAARPGKPEPATQPAPIASESRHARSLGRKNERHREPGPLSAGPVFRNDARTYSC